MSNYQDASSGLNKMFIAEVGALACAVLAAIPFVGVLAALAIIVFSVVSMIGLYTAGKDIDGCRTAFILTIVNIAIRLVERIPDSLLQSILGIAEDIISLLIVYFVCTSVAAVLKVAGALDEANMGNLVWKINLACYGVSIVIGVLLFIPGLAAIGKVLAIVTGIAMVVAGILYIIFLYKSSRALA